MATAVSTGTEPPHPSPPRGQGYNSVSRSQSTRSRPPTSTAGGPPTRATSHNHHHQNAGSSAAGRPVQDVLPHRDYETTNVAQYQKRSSSKDGHPPDSSSRPQRRNSQRSSHAPAAEMTPAVANNAGPAPVAQGAADARASGSKQSRSRTTIPTSSGKWILGKTIGAGSMGKVKLARKEGSNEQVCRSARCPVF